MTSNEGAVASFGSSPPDEASVKDRRGTWPQALGSLFGAILLILAIRWACFEPYVIPSGSMIPTLLIHDHILVNKFAYGLRLPFTSRWLVRFGVPNRGDIVVFRSIDDPGIFVVKRVIGLPGDVIRVEGEGQILVNDQPLERRKLNAQEVTAIVQDWPEESREEYLEKYDFYDEAVGKRRHTALKMKDSGERVQGPFEVPKDSIFMMGDNRDNSSDSRVWGALPLDHVLGRASLIWLSCEETLREANQLCDPQTLRGKRMGWIE